MIGHSFLLFSSSASPRALAVRGRRRFLLSFPDELGAEGFGEADIERLFAWQDGHITITDPRELHRLRRLAQLVLREEP